MQTYRISAASAILRVARVKCVERADAALETATAVDTHPRNVAPYRAVSARLELGPVAASRRRLPSRAVEFHRRDAPAGRVDFVRATAVQQSASFRPAETPAPPSSRCV